MVKNLVSFNCIFWGNKIYLFVKHMRERLVERVCGGKNVVKKMKLGDGCVKSVGGEAVMSKR